MREPLRTPQIVDAIRELVAAHPGAELLAVDRDLRLRESGSGALERILAHKISEGTDLQNALRDTPYSNLLVITDEEGADQVMFADVLGIATVDDAAISSGSRQIQVIETDEGLIDYGTFRMLAS